MKNKSTVLKVTFLAAMLAMACSTHAQAIPPIAGHTITINGQSFLLTFTNGNYVATSDGPNGTISVATPTSEADALAAIQNIISKNNPANAGFYGTNEWEARLGAVYEQNSGDTAALIGVIKWQPLFGQEIGFEGALLQGNQSGTSGTAGGYGAIDIRKVIGDVAAIGGIGGGYDNYNARMFGLVKVGVEYRQNSHLGEWIDLNYALEAKGSASRGFGFGGGITYSF